jgi:hypothetical protein
MNCEMENALNIPPRIKTRPNYARALAIAACIAIACGSVIVLFFYDPARVSIYPVCVFHKVTGFACPGCGATRAAHQLLHGEFTAAFRLNPLFILSLPFLGYVILREGIRLTTGRLWPLPQIRALWGWLLVALILFFCVVRNSSLPQFQWMHL